MLRGCDFFVSNERVILSGAKDLLFVSALDAVWVQKKAGPSLRSPETNFCTTQESWRGWEFARRCGQFAFVFWVHEFLAILGRPKDNVASQSARWRSLSACSCATSKTCI